MRLVDGGPGSRLEEVADYVEHVPLIPRLMVIMVTISKSK